MKKCCYTSQLKMNAKPDLYLSVELKHCYVFIEEKFLFRCINEIKNMLTLEPADLVYSADLTELKKQSDDI